MLTRSWFVVPMLLLQASLMQSCSKQDQGPPPAPEAMAMPATEVSVALVQDQSVTEWDEFTGRVEAKDTIEIRPRVGGYLAAVHFNEGKLVKKGQLLFSIDDREYQAALDSAKANLARAQTRVDLAGVEVARSNKLLAARAVSEEEFANRKGEYRQANADVQAALAQVSQARLNVDFTRIESPIDGRIGAALLRPGNLVAPGTSVLSTVVSIDPIYVYFDGDERAYLKFQAQQRLPGLEGSVQVRMGLSNESDFPHEGELDWLDNQLNAQTGTIRARAVFANTDGRLVPGLFARVQLAGSANRSALLIHDQAVLNDQDRQYVYVVGPSGQAVRKDVKLGAHVMGLRVAESGLQVGDRLVVNGVRKIGPGMPLKPVEVPMNDPNAEPVKTSGAAAEASGKG